MKNKRGISLVVLIVTIIVIIILATVIILTVTKNNPIEGSKEARFKEDVSNFQDDLSLTIAKEYTDKQGERDNKITTSDYNIIKEKIPSFIEKYKESFKILEDKLVYFGENEKEKAWAKDLGITIAVFDKAPGDISKNKNGETLKGDEELPYEINCIEDLVSFSQNINNGNWWWASGSYVVLTSNLDFESAASYIDHNSKEYGDLNGDGIVDDIKTELTKRGENCTGFIPIGTKSRSFAGSFDGKNFEILNIYENQSDLAGFFRSKGGGKVSNLTLTGEIISKKYAGGIIGESLGANIFNCTFKGSVKCTNSAGGIVGWSGPGNNVVGIIDSCSNFADVEADVNAGGLVGTTFEVTIKNSYNEGKVLSKTAYAGGIVGGTNHTPFVYNCYNKGTIKSDNNRAGGIIGSVYANIELFNTYNSGKIEGKTIGGIIGGALWNDPGNKIVNNFYLDTTANVGSNSVTDTSEKLTQEEMAGDVLINKLNGYKDENGVYPTDWKKWKKQINQFPVFN